MEALSRRRASKGNVTPIQVGALARDDSGLQNVWSNRRMEVRDLAGRRLGTTSSACRRESCLREYSFFSCS